MLQRLLSNAGIASDSAVNGKDAIQICSKGDKTYDLIFMDNTMPIMVRTVVNIAIIY